MDPKKYRRLSKPHKSADQDAGGREQASTGGSSSMKQEEEEECYMLTPAGEVVAELLSENRQLQAAVDGVWDIVRKGAYRGFDYSGDIARIRGIVEPNWSGRRKP